MCLKIPEKLQTICCTYENLKIWVQFMLMTIYSKENREYWKRYFDDKRRNQIQSYPISYKDPRFPYLKKKPMPMEKTIHDSLRKELETYKSLYYEEQTHHEQTIAKLHHERMKNRSLLLKIKKIKSLI